MKISGLAGRGVPTPAFGHPSREGIKKAPLLGGVRPIVARVLGEMGLQECGLPARMAALLAALPGGELPPAPLRPLGADPWPGRRAWTGRLQLIVKRSSLRRPTFATVVAMVYGSNQPWRRRLRRLQSIWRDSFLHHLSPSCARRVPPRPLSAYRAGPSPPYAALVIFSVLAVPQYRSGTAEPLFFPGLTLWNRWTVAVPGPLPKRPGLRAPREPQNSGTERLFCRSRRTRFSPAQPAPGAVGERLGRPRASRGRPPP